MTNISLNHITFTTLDQFDETWTIDNSQRGDNFSAAPGGKRRGEEQFVIDLLQKFQTHFCLPNQNVTQKIFDYALWTHQVTWDRSENLTIGKLKKIFSAFDSTCHYSGTGVKRGNVFSPNIGGDSHLPINEHRAIFDFLLSRQKEVPTSQIWENAKKILLEKDPVFFEGFQTELQIVLDDVFENVKQEKKDSFIMKTFVGNLLGLLPYTSPAVGKGFYIPIFKQDHWERVEYSVEKKIPLTPRWYSSPLPAFALTSKDGPPLLTFQGSTFPAGDGFWAAIVSDFCLGLPVGRLPSILGKNALKEWLKDKKNVQAYGVSLGGSIALHVAQEFESHFASVNAFNPSGFYPWNKRKMSIEVNIYSQWEDLVSTVGFFPEGPNVNIYRSMLDDEENFIKSHNRCYSGAENVTFIKTKPEYENKRPSRILLTILHIITPLFLLPIVIIHLVFRLLARLYELFEALLNSEDEILTD